MGTSNRASCSLILLTIFGLTLSDCATDPSDAQGLQVLFSALNNPSQLNNWKSSGGDPCGESWKGVTCQGSAVVSIQISGLGLNGTMGYSLTNFLSLKTLDMSANNIHDQIPYQLPPNLTSLNLAKNNLSGSLPYSLSTMNSLTYLNVSQNSFSQSVGDIFTNLVALVTLDLSSNNFTSDLPISFNALSNLSTLHLQDNQLTGSLNLLSVLPLTDLNVADNHFNGSIPKELLSIPHFVYDGNSFTNAPTPPSRGHGNRTHSPGTSSGPSGQSTKGNENKKNKLAAATIICIVVGSSVVFLLALLALLYCVIRNGKHKEFATGVSGTSLPVTADKEMQGQRMKSNATVADLRPIQSEKTLFEPMQGKNGSVKRVKSPITSSSAYTVASLQTATNSFSQENLVGEGSLGRVYKGEFPNGKIVAVKKIDNAALSLQEEDNFVEAISNMSRLRHPNINTLVGYCSEHGQRLLVYEYVSNGSLHDMLHFADEKSKLLTWNARVRVALGAARALEYLHEVCLPSVVHRNFKSANILLDDELNPHLSDCGLAALTLNKEREVSSTEMVEAFGYSAPECALSGIYTVKSDVYSFGVVMLELLTGRKPLDSSRVRSEQSLVRWATPQLHDIDSLSKMVDPALNGMYPAKSLSRFADIIALCVQAEPEFRPPMSEVVQALVRLMQRASAVRRHSSDGSGFMYKASNQDTSDT